MADADSEVVTLLTVRTTEGLEGVGLVTVWDTHAPGRGWVPQRLCVRTHVCAGTEWLMCHLEGNVQVRLLVSPILCFTFSEKADYLFVHGPLSSRVCNRNENSTDFFLWQGENHPDISLYLVTVSGRTCH